MKNAYEVHGDSAHILLPSPDGRTFRAVIDIADLPRAMAFTGTWRAHCFAQQYWYAYGWKGTTIALHRWLMDPERDELVDHINHDTLDNRRCNLRNVSREVNCFNRAGAPKHSSTGIRGVGWDKAAQRWRARVRRHGRLIFEGYFGDIRDAEKAVVAARARLAP